MQCSTCCKLTYLRVKSYKKGDFEMDTETSKTTCMVSPAEMSQIGEDVGVYKAFYHFSRRFRRARLLL